jgi:rubrerythrin
MEDKKPKRNDTYVCPKCGTSITVHVRVSEPPMCQNQEKHTSSTIVMELKGKSKN